MATRTVVVDDLTGTPIEGEPHTVTLMVNDRSTQLDLSPESAAELERVLAPYFGAAGSGEESQQSRQPRQQVPPQRNASNRAALAEIRKWAKANGYAVSERGRIPYAVMDAYTRSHMLTGKK